MSQIRPPSAAVACPAADWKASRRVAIVKSELGDEVAGSPPRIEAALRLRVRRRRPGSLQLLAAAAQPADAVSKIGILRVSVSVIHFVKFIGQR